MEDANTTSPPPEGGAYPEFLRPAERPVCDELVEHELVYGQNQEQYTPLRALRSHTADGQVLSRWTLTDWQRNAIAAGDDVFVEMTTFGDLLQPLRLFVAAKIESRSLRSHYDLDGPMPDGRGQPMEVDDAMALLKMQNAQLWGAVAETRSILDGNYADDEARDLALRLLETAAGATIDPEPEYGAALALLSRLSASAEPRRTTLAVLTQIDTILDDAFTHMAKIQAAANREIDSLGAARTPHEDGAA